MIPLALVLGVAAIFAFIWSIKSGQFDDMDGAARRILIDDPKKPEKDTKKQ